MTATDSPFALLGLAEGADLSAVRQAYRRRAFELHPDRNPSPDATAAFRAVHEAYQTLTDPARLAQTEADAVARDLIAAAQEAHRRRGCTNDRPAAWERVRFPIPPTVRDRLGRGYTAADWAAEVHPAGLDDLRWGLRLSWDAIDAIETDGSGVHLTLRPEDDARARAVAPSRAFRGSAYVVPARDADRLTAMIRRRAGC